MRVYRVYLLGVFMALFFGLACRPLTSKAQELPPVTVDLSTDTDALQEYIDYQEDLKDGYLNDVDSYKYATSDEVSKSTGKTVFTYISFALFFTFAKQIKSCFSIYTQNGGI